MRSWRYRIEDWLSSIGDRFYRVRYWWYNLSKRVKGVYLSILGLAVLAFTFSLLVGGSAIQKATAYETVWHYESSEEEAEIRYYDDLEVVILLKDGKEEVLSPYKTKVSPIMELPDTSVSEDKITSKDPISTLTWNTTPMKSQMYVNHLLSKGYKTRLTVKTSDWSEYIMDSDTSTKRLLIFRNIIMIGDMGRDAKLPSVESYIKKYRK